MKIEELERLATAMTNRLVADPYDAPLPMAVRAWKEKYREVLAEFIKQEVEERNPPAEVCEHDGFRTCRKCGAKLVVNG